MELKDSTLEFKSNYDPIPLSEIEEALLVWAGTGLTGLCLADLPPENGIDLLCQWTGRTWPSACNNHGTELFFTNDEGLYHVDVKNMLPKEHELDLFFQLSARRKPRGFLNFTGKALTSLRTEEPTCPTRCRAL